MGGEWSSGTGSNCYLEDKVEMPVGSSHRETCWSLYKAASSVDDSTMSVFVYSLLNTSSSDTKCAVPEGLLQCAQNNAKCLKVLRHPGIVRFLDMTLSSIDFWVITERVIPLQLVLDSLSPVEITAGLHNIVEALSFLHNNAGLCHNNVCLESVFVSETGVWKLAAMECTCRFNESTSEFLKKSQSFRSPSAVSADEQTGCTVGKEHGITRDVYGFYNFSECVLEYLSSLGDVVQDFQNRLEEEFLNNTTADRPPLNSLLDDPLFRNDFIEIVNFIRHLTLKTAEEKSKFFMELASKLYQLPVHLVGCRLTKMLLSRFVLLDETADEHLLPHLLQPYPGNIRPDKFVDDSINPIFPRPLYQRYILPELYKIFHVHDVHVRSVLLRYFHNYAALFDHSTLTKAILPQLLLSVRDTHDDLVMLSLNALATLVPIVGGDTVIGLERVQLFSRGHKKGAVSQSASPMSNGFLQNRVHRLQPEHSNDLHSSPERHRTREEIKNKSIDRRSKTVADRRDVKSIAISKATFHSSDNQLDNMADSDTDQLDHSATGVDDKVSVQQDQYFSPVTRNRTVDDDDDRLAFENSYDWKDSNELLPGVNDASQAAVQTGRTSSKALKLNCSKVKMNTGKVQTSPNTDLKDASFDDWGNSGWNFEDSLSPTKETNRASKAMPAGRGKFRYDQPLGAEFDVMQINVKTTSPVKTDAELDFFADMAPKFAVSPTQNSLFGLLSNEQQQQQQQQSDGTTSRFDVAYVDDSSTLDQVTGSDGWDVGFDWSTVNQ